MRASYIAALLFLPASIMAQWKNIAPNLLAPVSDGYGAIFFTDGMLWAGHESLWSSADSGKTWTKLPFTDGLSIRDIYFLDKLNGLVASAAEGLFLTRDGGQSWKNILNTECWEASFNGSPEIIHAHTTGPGVFYTSLDGGQTWSWTYLGTYGMSFAITTEGVIHAFTGERYLNSSRGWVNTSTDFGTTWSNNGAIVDGDSYTIAVDSCDPSRLYLVNEDFASTNDGESEFFISNDAGLSWEPVFADSEHFFAGALGTTRNTLYAGTVKNFGIYRSTDQGLTWTLSGGPAIVYDSRTIMPVNDNIVFAVSIDGSIWATFNSAGDSIVTLAGVDTMKSISSVSSNAGYIEPLDTVQIPVRILLPNGLIGVVPSEITFTLRYNPLMLNISQQDLQSFVLPSSGWKFVHGTVDSGSLRVTLADIGRRKLSQIQDFGVVIFTVETVPSGRVTSVFADSIWLSAQCRTHFGVFNVETGHLKRIMVIPAGIDSQSDSYTVSILPNPADEQVTIQSSVDLGRTYLTLFDELGKVMVRKIVRLDLQEPVTVDTGNLANGMYYLYLKSENRAITRSLLIQR